jgi:tetratricopeptide (TPR) repeat protein
MLIKTFTFLIILSSLISASVLSDKRKKIISVIDDELSESTRLAEQVNYKNPDLVLRMSELNLEKARLWRESENETYLSLSVEERRKTSKSQYFRNSHKFFGEANKLGLNLIQRFPNYKNLGDVYYILAYNFREIGEYKKADEYFKKASKKAPQNSSIYFRARMALAESYFNQKEYKKAVPLYEESLRNLDETWWTKDSFNLAWCYYRIKKYDAAIEKMKEVYNKSKNSKYVNMQSPVERDIGVFYVDARRLPEAIRFYQERGIPFSQYLVKIASTYIPQGLFSQADTLLDEALKVEKDEKQKTEIYLLQLELFEKFDKLENHLEISKLLVKLKENNKLDPEQIKKLEYQVGKKAALLQKTVAGGLYKNVKKTQNTKATYANEYFSLLDRIKGKSSPQNIFYQAETWYASGHFDKALLKYISCFEIAKNNTNKTLQTNSLDGMLSSLGQSSLSAGFKDKYYPVVYNHYLSFDSKSKKALEIFKKLFRFHLDKNDTKSAEQVLNLYAKENPSDEKTQEAMVAEIMERDLKNKNYANIQRIIKLIDNGQYRVSDSYNERLKELLTKLQIESVQTAMDKGNKSDALDGYIKIYENKESTSKARTNAAYNISALYFESNRLLLSNDWAKIALKSMTVNEVKPFIESFMAIANGLFYQQYFKESISLSNELLEKICIENINAKNILYKNIVFMNLAEENLDDSLQTIQQFSRCQINEDLLSEMRLEIGKDLAKSKRWESLENVLKPILNSHRYNVQALPLLLKLKKALSAVDQDSSSSYGQKIMKITNEAKSKNIPVPVEVLESLSYSSILKLKEKTKELNETVLTFPENIFNQQVKNKMQILANMESDTKEVQKLGAGQSIVEAMSLHISALEKFSREVKDFTPPDKSPEYIKSFKQAMSSVYLPIAKKAEGIRRDLKNAIHSNKILAKDNFKVLYPGSSRYYKFSNDYVLMDRGGRP